MFIYEECQQKTQYGLQDVLFYIKTLQKKFNILKPAGKEVILPSVVKNCWAFLTFPLNILCFKSWTLKYNHSHVSVKMLFLYHADKKKSLPFL